MPAIPSEANTVHASQPARPETPSEPSSDAIATAALVRALVKLYEDNASTLTPDPVYVRFHYSHPPASERLAALPAAFAAKRTGSRSIGTLSPPSVRRARQTAARPC